MCLLSIEFLSLIAVKNNSMDYIYIRTTSIAFLMFLCCIKCKSKCVHFVVRVLLSMLNVCSTVIITII